MMYDSRQVASRLVSHSRQAYQQQTNGCSRDGFFRSERDIGRAGRINRLCKNTRQQQYQGHGCERLRMYYCVLWSIDTRS